MIFNLKIVSDGEYFCVRKGIWPFYLYASKNVMGYWYPNDPEYYRWFLMTKEQAQHIKEYYDRNQKRKFMRV